MPAPPVPPIPLVEWIRSLGVHIVGAPATPPPDLRDQPDEGEPVFEAVTQRPEWQDSALCAQVDGDLWFPEKGESPWPAKRICGRCEVRGVPRPRRVLGSRPPVGFAGCLGRVPVPRVRPADRPAAGHRVTTTVTYRLTLPWKTPPPGMWGNTRVHWRVRSRSTRIVRETVAWLALQHDLPAGSHLTVGLEWAPGDRRRRDSDNLWPLLKACCDALARGRRDWSGLELVPDDTDVYLTRLAPRIRPPPAEPGMWLHVEIAPLEVS